MRPGGLFIIVLAFIFTAGCSILMPYKSEFQCPDKDPGKCVTVKEAYRESKGFVRSSPSRDEEDGKKDHGFVDDDDVLLDPSEEEPGRVSSTGKDTEKTESPEVSEQAETVSSDEDDMYRASLQKELTELIQMPVTPVVIPPRVMRILVLPYPEGDRLYMPRYIYLMVDDPEWVLGNYLMGGEEE